MKGELVERVGPGRAVIRLERAPNFYLRFGAFIWNGFILIVTALSLIGLEEPPWTMLRFMTMFYVVGAWLALGALRNWRNRIEVDITPTLVAIHEGPFPATHARLSLPMSQVDGFYVSAEHAGDLDASKHWRLELHTVSGVAHALTAGATSMETAQAQAARLNEQLRAIGGRTDQRTEALMAPAGRRPSDLEWQQETNGARTVVTIRNRRPPPVVLIVFAVAMVVSMTAAPWKGRSYLWLLVIFGGALSVIASYFRAIWNEARVTFDADRIAVGGGLDIARTELRQFAPRAIQGRSTVRYEVTAHRLDGGVERVPVRVETAREADFVALRLNEILAANRAPDSPFRD